MVRNGHPIRHILRWAAVAVAAVGLATSAAGQTPALDRAKTAQAIADQKAADDVARAIADAQARAKVSTVQAVQRLKQVQTSLDLAVTISSRTRQELVGKLENAIAALEGRAARTVAEPKGAVQKEAERQLREQAMQESKDVAAGIAEARRSAEAGNLAAARRQAEALAARYPRNPMALALAGQQLTADLLRQQERDAREYQLAWVGNLNQVARDATPIVGDVQFPDKETWAKLTAARRQQDQIKLTSKEQEILKSLDKAVGVLFNDRPFEEALQELSNMIDQPIFLDKKSLEDAGLDLSRRVTFKGNVSARTALRALLQANGLTFVVKNEMIQVVTVEKAEREMLTTRSYYLGDVIQGVGAFGNAVQWGPWLNYQQTAENANAIVNLIKESVDPNCWKEKGGPCTIAFHLPTMSVVVRGSTEVHAALAGAVVGRK